MGAFYNKIYEQKSIHTYDAHHNCQRNSNVDFYRDKREKKKREIFNSLATHLP